MRGGCEMEWRSGSDHFSFAFVVLTDQGEDSGCKKNEK